MAKDDVNDNIFVWRRVAENHWRSIHAAKAERAAEERERKRREIKERIKEIEVRINIIFFNLFSSEI